MLVLKVKGTVLHAIQYVYKEDHSKNQYKDDWVRVHRSQSLVCGRPAQQGTRSAN